LVLKNTAFHFRFGLAAMAAVLMAVAWWLWGPDILSAGPSHETVERWVKQVGVLGPLLIVCLMVVAVVASPIPSAPIAVAAGAAYGHTLGTVLVAAGAEIGALLAFLFAKWLGHDALRKRFGNRLDMGLLGSQNVLMMTVFASRLMPFVSFDLMSYAAGLTRLHFWRFALATFAGILPASFLLAHLGGEIAEAESNGVSLAVFALGLGTGIPLLILAWRRNGSNRNTTPGLSKVNAQD
jgi:uncharacterized membrane protein YdjX (TVP38/TMEM64 family)